MLIVKDIKKKFVRLKKSGEKEEFYADNGISFEAKEGEIVGILVQMGLGKRLYFV